MYCRCCSVPPSAHTHTLTHTLSIVLDHLSVSRGVFLLGYFCFSSCQESHVSELGVIQHVPVPSGNNIRPIPMWDSLWPRWVRSHCPEGWAGEDMTCRAFHSCSYSCGDSARSVFSSSHTCFITVTVCFSECKCIINFLIFLVWMSACVFQDYLMSTEF